MQGMNIHFPAILVLSRVPGFESIDVHSNFHVEVFKYIKDKGSISNADLDAALGPVAKIGSLASHGASFGRRRQLPVTSSKVLALA